MLYQAYRNSLTVAYSNGVTHIGFCLLSSSIFSGDRGKEAIIKLGLIAILEFFRNVKTFSEICLFAFQDDEKIVFRLIIKIIKSIVDAREIDKQDYQLIDVQGDGKCLFHSIKGFLDLENKEFSKLNKCKPQCRGAENIYTGDGSNIRTETADWLKVNLNTYLFSASGLTVKEMIKNEVLADQETEQEVTDEKIMGYIQSLEGGMWGGEFEISIISYLLERDIYSYTINDSSYKRVSGGTYYFPNNNKIPITLLYYSNNHYMILFPKSKLVKGGSRLNKQNNNNIKKRKRSINRNNRNRIKRQTTGKKRNTKGKKRHTTGRKRQTTGKKIHRQNKKTHRK